MQRSAGLVLLALVGEVALSHIERLGHAFVEMRRNDRAGAHTDVQHDRPQRVIRVADPQRDVALTGERETIRLELIVEYFLIDHDTVSCASKSPPADLISEAAWLFLELTKRLPLPKKEAPGAHNPANACRPFLPLRASARTSPAISVKNRVRRRVRDKPAIQHRRSRGSRETGASSGGRNPAEQHPIPIHLLGAPWPPRSIQGKMLIAISESGRPRRNSVRYPVNAGLNDFETGSSEFRDPNPFRREDARSRPR